MSIRILSTNIVYYCIWIIGLFPYLIILLIACEFRCKTCQFTDSQCLSCPDLSNRLLDTVNLKCPCAYGFMENNVITCIPCSYKCGECVTTITTCSSCKVNSFRTWDAVSDCPCNSGYYDDGSSDAC